jgi:cytochrome P450
MTITTTVHADASVEVPDDLTLYYDPMGYADYDHPYELFKRLRDEAPVYYNSKRDLYVVSRYEDVRAAFNDPERLSNAKGNDVDGTHDSYGEGMLVTLDAPRHTALRAAIRRTFSARAILVREDGVRAYAKELVSGMWEADEADAATQLAVPMGIGLAMMLLGAPEQDRGELVAHLERAMVRIVGERGVPEDAAAANRETEELIARRFAERRAQIDAGASTKTNDAYTQILLGVHAGKVFPSEQDGLAHLVLSAGSDAPAALLTNCLAVLDKFPAMQDFLRRNPTMVPQFVEETLRYDTPGQNVSRQTTTEVEIAGTRIPADSRVMLLQASANRDERVFPDPDRFDLTREFTPANRIMSFGDGIHACMGAPFARLAAKVVLEELLQGPNFHVSGTPERWRKQLVRGFSSLPLKFDR